MMNSNDNPRRIALCWFKIAAQKLWAKQTDGAAANARRRGSGEIRFGQGGTLSLTDREGTSNPTEAAPEATHYAHQDAGVDEVYNIKPVAVLCV